MGVCAYIGLYVYIYIHIHVFMLIHVFNFIQQWFQCAQYTNALLTFVKFQYH